MSQTFFAPCVELKPVVQAPQTSNIITRPTSITMSGQASPNTFNQEQLAELWTSIDANRGKWVPQALF